MTQNWNPSQDGQVGPLVSAVTPSGTTEKVIQPTVALVDSTGAPYSPSNPLPIVVETSVSPATGVTTTVVGSATPVTILAANTARLGATVTNDSTAILYLLLGGGTASTSVYTVELAGTGGGVPAYYEVPYRFTGIITGIWASAAGNARATEFTA